MGPKAIVKRLLDPGVAGVLELAVNIAFGMSVSDDAVRVCCIEDAVGRDVVCRHGCRLACDGDGDVEKTCA